MGGCCSVSLSCGQMVNQASQWLCLKGSYIRNLSENLKSLEKAIEVLKEKRDVVQGRVNREESTGRRRRLAQVQVWLTSILTIEEQYNDLFSTSELELQRLCLCGVCSKDLKLSYRYGKMVILMLREVESLTSQGEFDVVTEAASVAEGEVLPIQPIIVGQETILEKVWNRLMEDEIGILGLYGMGGVGKTTLLKQINNRFSQRISEFDIVIWVVVSNNATVHKIQGDIGEKLGFKGKEWDEKNETQRARDIHIILRMKKFVLLLDDIWEKVSLNVVGVPYPNRENGCKVAFTTRSQDVCWLMEVSDPIEVRCLDTEDAWELFQQIVGRSTLGSHPDIPKLARKVVENCRGLPLALNVIGETMSCKRTAQEWRHAVDVLTSSATEVSVVEDGILPFLKYCYDSLYGEQVKSCFLYCSLFPEDSSIDKEALIEYWIGEGFIDEKEGRERALNHGYEILGTLVRACLLLEEESSVKMHDVVREMALWIASDLGKRKERWIVQANVGLSEIPKVKNWKSVTRMSLMNNEIEEISGGHDCPKITTLLLGRNLELVTISGKFFRCMSRLLVLDLSGNYSLKGLPEEVSCLVCLRYLNLSGTKIELLPVGLQELKMLTHLNLEETRRLESLRGVSKLSNLRTLKLEGSKVWLDMSLMKELQLLEHLEFVSITIRPRLVGEGLSYDPRVGRFIQQIAITEDNLEKESVRVLVLPAADNLREVSMWNCGTLEIKIPGNNSLSTPCFLDLSRVLIKRCNGLKDLTWLLFAPNLTHLSVMESEQIEEIISKEKAASFSEKETCPPFQRLQVLVLADLPKLKSIYWNALPFQRLKRFEINGECLKLRKLPLGYESVYKVEEFAIYCEEEEWLRRIEWEDEATRLRFLPSLRLGSSQIKIEKIPPWNKTLSPPRFPNLTIVEIFSCDGVKDLTWLLFAPNLIRLRVDESKQIEEIINKEKAAIALDKVEEVTFPPFQKLEFLSLRNLPELKSIYRKTLSAYCLKSLLILGKCPKLRKLPLDSKSVSKVEELVIEYSEEEWKQGIEWKDVATRDRFLPSLRLRKRND